MKYIFLFLIMLPCKLLMKLRPAKKVRNLVIQTAKIGDFINITPLLTHLQHSDALLSRTVAPLAQHDDMLDEIFYVEDYKISVFAKLKLAFRLMNRYENVYLLHPNNTNLFYAACCNADNKQFLSVYRRRWYQIIFYLTANGVVEHEKSTLTLENYLKLADRSLTKESYPKHTTHPLVKLADTPEEVFRTDKIKIGISISAGNHAKTIPPVVWKSLFDRLRDLPCLFYIFGSPNELTYLNALNKVTGERDNLVNLIGKISLPGLPYTISQMDFYVASDSGNVYIADSQNVPVILIYGPCCMEEQRPLGDVLLIGPNHIAPTSFVFQTPYRFTYPAEKLFALDQRKLDDIYDFICTRKPQFIPKEKPYSEASAPELSVIIPMFNAGKSFEAFMASLLAQTLQSIEIIIVNDGSTDESADMAHQYAARYTHVQVIDQPNGGVSRARNAGMAISKGNYVTFPDADDKLAPGMYSRLMAMAKADDLDIAQCNAERVFWGENDAKALIPTDCLRSTSVLSGAEWLNKALATNRYLHVVWLGIYRRSLLNDLNLQFEPGLHHQDIPWTTELMLNASRVRYTEEILYRHYVHSLSISNRKRAGMHNVEYQRHYLKIARMLDEINQRYKSKVRITAPLYRQVTKEALTVCHAIRREPDAEARQMMIADLITSKTPGLMLRNARGLSQWYQLLLWLSRIYRWRQT